MRLWNLGRLPPSTKKQSVRAPGADAPRVPRTERQIPRVLFSSPECRVVAIELVRGETMGDHHVRERAVVQVVSGRVAIEASGGAVDCDAGTVVTFAPGEAHSVRALQPAMLLLILAPWPAATHYVDESEAEHAQELPANAFVEPLAPGNAAA